LDQAKALDWTSISACTTGIPVEGMMPRGLPMAILVVIVAIAACPATARRLARPTYGEWQEGQANATAAADAKLAKQKKMSAVDKVVELLEGLRSKVLSEGEKEAATYNKFSCFCKDTSAEKSAAITKGQDDQTDLTAKIGTLSSDRDALDTRIQTLMGDIEDAEGEMAQARATRASELKTYTANANDLQAALDALEGAIKSVKSSKSPSFAQFPGVSQTVHTALLLADALGLSAAKKASAFFQQAPSVPTEDYKFHSNDIITTLENLLDEFRAKKVEVDQDEVSAVKAHDQFMQDKTHLVKTKTAELEDAKDKKATTADEIASASQQLSTTSATLLEDQEYLKELTRMCREKAITWDQRSRVRADELATLTQVIGIISDEVASNTTAATIRFSQQGVSVRLARAVAGSEAAMEAVEAEAEAAEASDGADSALAFVQQKQDKTQTDSFLSRRPAAADDGRSAVAELLRRKGGDLKSTLLTALAGQISNSKDPFGKVKALIQELIERLLQEAANTNDQKGWCDKSLSEAKQRRGYAAEKIQELNGQMADLEATRDKLAEELAVLTQEIGELNTTRADAQRIRDEEQAENAETVQEAQAGMSALDTAMTIVDRFYKTTAKEAVDLSLAQRRGPFDDAPDAGFANGEAYTGAQGEAGGILGMMEVMKSDFARTISETEAAEAQAQEDHLEFLTETGKSLAQKNMASSERTAQKSSAEDKLQTADDDLEAETGKLQTALQELLELKPVCIDTGMTYAERVSLREDEIEALHKALCILDNYAEYGPTGAADAC